MILILVAFGALAGALAIDRHERHRALTARRHSRAAAHRRLLNELGRQRGDQ